MPAGCPRIWAVRVAVARPGPLYRAVAFGTSHHLRPTQSIQFSARRVIPRHFAITFVKKEVNVQCHHRSRVTIGPIQFSARRVIPRHFAITFVKKEVNVQCHHRSPIGPTVSPSVPVSPSVL
jgi:hypothetical protein